MRPHRASWGFFFPAWERWPPRSSRGSKRSASGLVKPVGSVTQTGTIRLGKRTDKRSPLVRDFVPLAELKDIEFAGWDCFPDNAYVAAKKAGVLHFEHLAALKPFLDTVSPWPAVFDQNYVKKLQATHVKTGKNKMDLAEQVMADIESFRKAKNLARLVMVWCGSTEVYKKETAVHQTIEAFEQGLRDNDPDIAPSMIYAYAAIKLGIPYANGAPNLSADFPGPHRSGEEDGHPHRRQGFQDRSDPDEDHPGARPQGAAARDRTAGSPPTSSETATAKCSRTRSRSRPRK